MSLYWDWNKKVGKALMVNPDGENYTLTLYKGNAFLIMLYEYKNKQGTELYNMYNFFVDKVHAKNCFGMTKGYNNIYEGNNSFVNLTFYRDKCDPSYLADIVKIFSTGLPNVPILILPKSPSDEC